MMFDILVCRIVNAIAQSEALCDLHKRDLELYLLDLLHNFFCKMINVRLISNIFLRKIDIISSYLEKIDFVKIS